MDKQEEISFIEKQIKLLKENQWWLSLTMSLLSRKANE